MDSLPSALPVQLPLFPSEKRCTKCGLVKPFADFTRGNDPHGLNYWCKACAHARYREKVQPKLSGKRLRLWAADGPDGKVCRVCGLRQPLAEYGPHPKTRDGHETRCRTCRRAYSQEHAQEARARSNAWYWAHRDRALAAARTWAEEHRDERCAYMNTWLAQPHNRARKRDADKAWRAAHPERVRTVQRAWRSAHAECVQAYRERWNVRHPDGRQCARRRYEATHKMKIAATRRAYAQAPPDVVRDRTRRWRARNPERARLQRENRRAREAGAPGVLTVMDVQRLYDAQSGRCFYCGRPLGATFHRDHKVPLSRGGTHWPDNIALACGSCNAHKWMRTSEEFAAYRQALGEQDQLGCSMI